MWNTRALCIVQIEQILLSKFITVLGDEGCGQIWDRSHLYGMASRRCTNAASFAGYKLLYKFLKWNFPSVDGRAEIGCVVGILGRSGWISSTRICQQLTSDFHNNRLKSTSNTVHSTVQFSVPPPLLYKWRCFIGSFFFTTFWTVLYCVGHTCARFTELTLKFNSVTNVYFLSLTVRMQAVHLPFPAAGRIRIKLNS